jgi:hypothetical protein
MSIKNWLTYDKEVIEQPTAYISFLAALAKGKRLKGFILQPFAFPAMWFTL